MALTAEQITKAVNDAGFDQEALTRFLIAGKLQVELNLIGSQLNNLEAKRSQTTQDYDAQRQALLAEREAKQDEINALSTV